VLREVRDTLRAAKSHWLSMDYDSEAKLSANDIMAAATWNGPSMRARLNNPRRRLRLSPRGLHAVDGLGGAALGRAERR
jgi:hypothetical protein